MRRLLLFTISFFFLISVSLAQESFISVDELPSMAAEDISLGNDKSVVCFLAASDQFQIVSSNHSDRIVPVQRRSDGRYLYKVETNLSDGRDRTFAISRLGTALMAEKKKYLAPGEILYFEIKEAEHKITLQRQNTRNTLYPVSGKALLEFTTPVPNMTVHYSDAIGARLTRKSEDGGVEVLSLEIDVARLKALQTAMTQADEAEQKFQEEADLAEEFTEVMREEEQRLQALKTAAQMAWQQGMMISLSSDKSNEVYVDADDIASLQPKQKISYGILDMFQTVGTTPYAQNLNLANKAREARRFSEAANAYRAAAESEGATENDMQTCLASAEEMQRIKEIRDVAEGSLRKLGEYKHKGDAVSPDTLVALYDIAIARNEQLYGLTGDEYFAERANKVKVLRDKVGLVVRGTVLSTQVKQGIVREAPIVGIDIYGITTVLTANMEEGIHGDYLGSVTKADGSFQIQIPRSTYKGLLFVPTNNSAYKKNVWQPLSGNQHTQLKIRFKKK